MTLAPDLPLLTVSFRFQKVLLSLLCASVESSSQRGKIKAFMFQEKVVVTLEDSGFYLSIEDHLGLKALKNEPLVQIDFKETLQSITALQDEIVIQI